MQLRERDAACMLVPLGGRALQQAGGLGGVALDSVAVRVHASKVTLGLGEALTGGQLVLRSSNFNFGFT